MILQEWRSEFNAAIQAVQSKLDKLGSDKLSEVASLYNEKLLFNNKIDLSKNKKDLIKIDCREEKKTPGGNYHALKQMVRELDRMVAASQANTFDSCVPIYNLYANDGRQNVVATPYEFPLQKYIKYLKAQGTPTIPTNPRPKVDIKDFIANNQPKIVDEPKLRPQKVRKTAVSPKKKKVTKAVATIFQLIKKKEIKRETNAMSKREKMLERRTKKKREATVTNQGFSYRLRQYSCNGEEHYLIVKKKVPSNEEVEDIFTDWIQNLDEHRRIRPPRVRKLSHRAQRKEYLKQNSYPVPDQGKTLKLELQRYPIKTFCNLLRKFLLC